MPLIVGGGPAGAAAAIRLAKAGRRPVIVERTAAPADMLCGGFLSWNCVKLLTACDIDPLALGGHAVHRARLFAGSWSADIALPAPSVGLSRRTLDDALLRRAADLGAQVRRGITVRAVEGGTIRFADGTSQTPEAIILATGKHDLRGTARPVTSPDPAIGLRWRIRASPALIRAIGGTIEMHLFQRGYAGLILQEEGWANLCLAVRKSAFDAAGKDPQALLASVLAQTPVLAERTAGEALGDAQAVANIPYGWRARGGSHGLYRVGDQIGVIPSLAGEGVGIAIATGLAAADAILGDVPADAYQHACSRRIAPPIGAARLLWSLAERPALARLALPLLSGLPMLGSAITRLTRTPPPRTALAIE